MARPQFRLKCLFILTAVVAALCVVGQWIVRVLSTKYATALTATVLAVVGFAVLYGGAMAADRCPGKSWPVMLAFFGFILTYVGMIAAFVSAIAVPG